MEGAKSQFRASFRGGFSEFVEIWQNEWGEKLSQAFGGVGPGGGTLVIFPPKHETMKIFESCSNHLIQGLINTSLCLMHTL